jgi:Lon protease-like protein
VTDGSISPELRAALRALRKVRSERPSGEKETEAFAAWRERIAQALETLTHLLPFPEDRQQAADEAREARAQAERIRARLRS